MTRNDVLSRAIDECIKEFYSIAQPHIEWEDLKEQCRKYSEKYLKWENYMREGIKFNILDFCGPRPFEFHYLPQKIQNDIADSYIYAYKIDNQQELLDTIDILKNYCKKPIVDKYINDWTDETGFHHPGYRGYDHPNNLEKELIEICSQHSHEPVNMAKELQDKFFEFLDMAGNFYNWNHELNTFNMSVFMGIAPSTNKEKVIDYWKKYRNKDIEIDEKQMKEDYYGEELD